MTDLQVGDRLHAAAKRQQQIQDDLKKKYESQNEKVCTFLPKTNLNKTAKRQRASTQAPESPEKVLGSPNAANEMTEVHKEDETPYEKSEDAESPQRSD